MLASAGGKAKVDSTTSEVEDWVGDGEMGGPPPGPAGKMKQKKQRRIAGYRWPERPLGGAQSLSGMQASTPVVKDVL